jgi:hypothetical protein
MSYRTKIVFSHGEEVGVQNQVRKVQRRLSKDRRAGRAFTKFRSGHGTDVYIAADQVAYIEQVPDGLWESSVITKKSQSHKVSLSGGRRPSPNREGRPRESRRSTAPPSKPRA